MKNMILCILLCALSTKLIAQTISGIVLDKANAPINYATVVLCHGKDTTQVAYTITDDDGKFSITSSSLSNKVTDYLLQVSYIGCKSVYVQAQSTQEIILEQDALAFDEAVVKEARPISKITAGGVLTTIENTAISDIGTGNDVLKRIPMLSGDDGAYEVFGRGEAKIYINNREVRDPSEIDNLNSSDIQSVEVISSSGARYDASVKAVINIKTIKRQGDGFSFNARTSFYTWDNEDYINQLNTNYRSGGLDVFANIYHVNMTSFQKGTFSQTTNVDTLWTQQTAVDGLYKYNKLNGTIGANYEINENHYIGLRYDIKTSPNKNVDIFNTVGNVYADSVHFDKMQNNNTINKKPQIGSQVNLYYAGKLNMLSIDANIDYMNSGVNINSQNIEKSSAYGDSIYNSENDVNNKLWASKVQLSYPIRKGKILVGSEYVNITRVDDYINYDLDDFTSKVNIEEGNLALFTQYNIGTKIGNFALGIRYENVDYSYIVDSKKDDNMSKKYNQWFPNFSYSNKLGDIGLQLNYTSNVIRPTYSQLSNNLLYANKYTIQSGNPSLSPAINHNISLMGVWKFIQAQISYTYQRDAILRWIDVYETDSKITFFTYKNTDYITNLSAYLSASYKFGIWKPQLNLGVRKQWLNLLQDELNQTLGQPVYTIALNNTFELGKGYIINLDGSYRSKGNDHTAYAYKDALILDFGVSKRFLKDALQVQLDMSDILRQKLQTFRIYFPQGNLVNNFRNDTREISLTLRYNFNSTRNRYKGEGAGEDAKQRF